MTCNHDVMNWHTILFPCQIVFKASGTTVADFFRPFLCPSVSVDEESPTTSEICFILPFIWNWKTSDQTVTLLNGIREEPRSNLDRGPTFLILGIFSFCSIPLNKFCRVMCQRNSAVLNAINRHSSLKLKFNIVFKLAFHWSLFSLTSIQITPHSSMMCLHHLKPTPRSFLGVFQLLWYLCFLLIYAYSIWATQLIHLTTWDYWLKNTDPEGNSEVTFSIISLHSVCWF